MSITLRNFLLLAMVIILGLISLSRRSPAEELHVSEAQAMVIDGVIQGDNLSAIESAILRQKSTDQVDLVINSPGGSVVTGFQFISIMESARSRGIHFRCFVPHVAASMAFQILLHCDERHVLQKSFLLWHRARVQLGGMFGEAMTAPQLATISKSLDDMDQLIFREVLENVHGMSEESIRYHFENETLHVGELLSQMSPLSFQSHSSIPGLFEALGNQKLPRTTNNELGQFNRFRFGEIIYINPTVRK